MSVTRKNLGMIVSTAWEKARKESIRRAAQAHSKENGDRNRGRSSAWVGALAKEFEDNYCAECHRVFCVTNKNNKEEFGRNEFLFDVTVAEIGWVDSLENKGNMLPFIGQSKWIVESEFNKENSRHIIIDLSKLVMGASKNKLLIVSQRSAETENKLRDRFASIAKCCSGDLFLSFVAHPSDWCDAHVPKPRLFRWHRNHWIPLSVE